MVIHVGYQNAEQNPLPKFLQIGLRPSAMSPQDVSQFQIAAGLTISRTEHAHRRKKWNSHGPFPVEAGHQQYLPASHLNKPAGRNMDSRFLGEFQGQITPGLDAVFVLSVREFGNQHSTVRIRNRRFRPRPTQRRSRRKQQPQVLIRIFFRKHVVRRRKELGQENQGRYSMGTAGKKLLIPRLLESKGALANRIIYPQQKVNFHQTP